MTATSPNAHSLGAFRGCRHDYAIAYRATLEATGQSAITTILTALENANLCASHDTFDGEMRAGAITTPDYYAVLDITDRDGLWIDTRAIPTESAFEQIRQTLALRIKSSDCDAGCK